MIRDEIEYELISIGQGYRQKQGYGQFGQDEGKSYGVVTEERLYVKETESILQIIPDPNLTGTEIEYLMETLEIDKQGEMKFPRKYCSRIHWFSDIMLFDKLRIK